MLSGSSGGGDPTLVEVLSRAAALTLPDWYLVAGCLYQTVWNVVTGQPPESGILDYDLAYYDGSDLSAAAAIIGSPFSPGICRRRPSTP